MKWGEEKKTKTPEPLYLQPTLILWIGIFQIVTDLVKLHKVGQFHKINCGLKAKAFWEDKEEPTWSRVFLLHSLSVRFWGTRSSPHMAPAIGMQMSLVLLGLSSGLQLGRHRYARKVNQLPGMGREEGGRGCRGWGVWGWGAVWKPS